MRDLAELGMLPRWDNPYPPATAAEIAEFERYMGLMIPEAFAIFLQFTNGGRPTLSVYDDPNGGTGEVNDFYGLGSKAADDEAARRGTWDIGNLWGESRSWRLVLGEFAIPFASDGCDNQLYLDLSTHHAPVNRLIAATRQRYQLASSFDAFIDMLRPRPEGARKRRVK